MKKNTREPDKHITALFAGERNSRTSDESRINRIMLRIHQEIGVRHLTLLIFVRIWMSLLQLGAILYVGASKRRHHGANKTVPASSRPTGPRGRRP